MASSRRLPASYNVSTYGTAVNAKLLLHMEGVDDAHVFTDSSASEHNVIAHGTKTENTQRKFGLTSAYFNGVGDYLLIDDDEDFNFGSDEFTIDLWFYVTSAPGVNDFLICQAKEDHWSAQSSFALFFDGAGHVSAAICAPSYTTITSTTAITTNTWHHVALVRSGNTVSLYYDGVSEGTALTSVGTLNNSAYPLQIGVLQNGAGNYTTNFNIVGYIDEICIVKGSARWTTNFTPPNSPYSIGATTRDYSSLAAWEAATDNDLITATKGEVLECYDDETSFDDSVSIAGATTNSSYFRVIKPAAGEGHDGTPNNGVTFDSTTVELFVFYVGENYSQLQDLIVTNSFRRSGDIALVTASSEYGVVVGCIAFNGTNTTSGRNLKGILVYSSSIAVNCLSFGHTASGTAYAYFTNPSSGDTVYFYNCTAVDCTTGFAGGDTQVAKNCISCDCTTDFSGTWTKTTCYEGDATVFANQVGDDYHLASGDTTARGNGTDLSADATYAFDDDIDGNTRSAWDIGFDEYAASGWAGKVLGVTGIAKINGVAVADIANVMGV